MPGYLDGTEFICIFDRSVWRAYGNTSVFSKPSYWKYVGRRESHLEFIWNLRPPANKFVLDKCRLRTNYDVWFLMFSGSLHVARSLQ